MPDQEPPKRTVQMYDRPASADQPPLQIVKVAAIIGLLLIIAIVAAKFIFHLHFGHLLHAGH